MRPFVLGTAGHIDHGKTSLVRRLTGIDTDRLPEEKKRGITIDLGFANLDIGGTRLGIVDVPGHERFIHNMVAGATGMDAVLLVVAADDSVMPQTIEHLEILHLLGVECGIVAITKADLVDADHLALVREEIVDLLALTPLASAPIVAVSSTTGYGIDELFSRLAEFTAQLERRRPNVAFRMPIDRVFTLPGHGAIVTGTVMNGAAGIGDEFIIARTDEKIRIRGLHSHDRAAETVEAGQRAALNLVGVKHDQIERGDEICLPGRLRPSRRLLVEYRHLRSMRPLRNRSQVRLHLATRDIAARVVLRGETVGPGETRFLELRTAQPVVAEWGQRFIVRQPSPPATLGGGRVVDPSVDRFERIRDPEATGAALASSSPSARLARHLENRDFAELTPLEWTAKIGCTIAEHQSATTELVNKGLLIRLSKNNDLLIHRQRRNELIGKIVERCKREVERRQPCRAIDRTTLHSSCRRFAQPATLNALIDAMIVDEQLTAVDGKIGLPGQRSTLSKAQRQMLAAIVSRIGDGARCPPTVAELARELNQTAKDVERLAEIGCQDGLLLRIGPGLFYAPGIVDEMQVSLVAKLEAGPMTVGQIREELELSRKYAVPLCEFFDAGGVTVRRGDLRFAVQRSDALDSTK